MPSLHMILDREPSGATGAARGDVRMTYAPEGVERRIVLSLDRSVGAHP